MLLGEAWKISVSDSMVRQCKASEMREFDISRQVKKITKLALKLKGKNMLFSDAGDTVGTRSLVAW